MSKQKIIHTNTLYKSKKVAFSIILVSCLTFLSGCQQLEESVPEEVLEFFGLEDDVSEEDEESGIETALNTSGESLRPPATNQNENGPLVGIRNFILDDNIQAVSIEDVEITDSSIIHITLRHIDQEQRQQQTEIPTLASRVPVGSPSGIANRDRRWLKLDEYQSLYYIGASNYVAEQPLSTGDEVLRNSENYIEYHAVSAIAPGTPEEDEEEPPNEEVVRIQILLLNDIDTYRPHTRFNYETSDPLNLNEAHQGLYNYNIGYGIWYDEDRLSSDLPTTGTAKYTGLFLGRQRLAITNPNAPQIPLILARESKVPVMTFNLDFANANDTEFRIENAELKIINAGYTGDVTVDIQGTGELGNLLEGRIESVTIDMVAQATGSETTFQNRFTLNQFEDDQDVNYLEGYFFDGRQAASILAGFLYASGTQEGRRITLGNDLIIGNINFYIDGLFIAEE